MFHKVSKVKVKSDNKELFVERIIYRTNVDEVLFKLSDGKHYNKNDIEIVG